MVIEGFSHFVTSLTALIASGWSGCRVEHPLESAAFAQRRPNPEVAGRWTAPGGTEI
jgi:hypothetical protein